MISLKVTIARELPPAGTIRRARELFEALCGARIVNYLRHGAWWMVGWRHVRPVRLLRARIRGWCRVQRGEHCVDWMVGDAPPMTMAAASHVHPTG